MLDLTYRNFKSCFEPIKTVMSRERDLTLSDLQELSETAIFLKEMTASMIVADYDKENFDEWLDQLQDRIGLRLETVYSQFWYTVKKYDIDPFQNIDSGIKVAVSLRAMKILGVNFYTDHHTAYKYLERDIPPLLEMLYKKLDGVDTHLWFLTYNLLDLLYSLKDENSGIFYGYFKRLKNFLVSNEKFILEVCITNPGFKTYTSEIVQKYGISINIDKSVTSINGKGLVFHSLNALKNGIIPEERVFSALNSTKFGQFYWMISAWIANLNGIDNLHSLPYTGKIDVEKVFKITWGELNPPDPNSFTQAEIDIIYGLGDSEIRTHLFDYFIGHPNVTAESKANLGLERDKSNAGAEISDFNVEMEVGTKRKVVVAIPIKSGKELGSSGIDRIREKYTHQLIRPLVRLPGRCVTQAIMIAKPTLNLRELVTEMNNNLDLPISIIDAMTYGAFLKREGLL